MKTLHEIIETVKDGEIPTTDEMRFAICAMDALTTFDHMAILKLSEGETENKKKIMIYSAEWQWKEMFDRWKRALNEDPQTWLGKNNNPDNPAYQQHRRVARQIWDKIARKNHAH